jgi:hypothetical protein
MNIALDGFAHFHPHFGAGIQLNPVLTLPRQSGVNHSLWREKRAHGTR